MEHKSIGFTKRHLSARFCFNFGFSHSPPQDLLQIFMMGLANAIHDFGAILTVPSGAAAAVGEAAVGAISLQPAAHVFLGVAD